jgi:hypothetical protein
VLVSGTLVPIGAETTMNAGHRRAMAVRNCVVWASSGSVIGVTAGNLGNVGSNLCLPENV